MAALSKNRALILAGTAAVLALIAAAQFAGPPSGPACTQAMPATPGFAALSARSHSPCVRIPLR